MTERVSYEVMHSTMEWGIANVIEMASDHGDFQRRWDRARTSLLAEHKWTEKDFYAEMDKRRCANFIKGNCHPTEEVIPSET